MRRVSGGHVPGRAWRDGVHRGWRDGVHGTWHHVDGKLKCIHVAGNGGEHVWGVNAEDDIFYRPGPDGGWQH